jgi:hypothetical protein
MKTLIALLLLLGVSTNVSAQSGGTASRGAQAGNADGILQSIENANVTHAGDDLLLKRVDARAPIELLFSHSQGIGVQYQENQWWVLPIGASNATVNVNRAFWILPLDAKSTEHSWHLVLHDGDLLARQADGKLTLSLRAEGATLSKAQARPHSDILGHRFSLEFSGGAELEQALAAFY